eukprot:Hpha_TRINITY_DN16562_c6_g4::TRINITY_DN16562_c6_g4_i1::g.134142::m.134142
MEHKAEGNPPSPEPARHGLMYALPPPTLELDEKVEPVPMDEDLSDVHPYDLGMRKITPPTAEEVAELNAVFKLKMYSRPRRRKIYRDAKCGTSEPGLAKEARKDEAEDKATEEEKEESEEEKEESEEEKEESEEEKEESEEEKEEEKEESDKDESEEDKSSEMDAEERIADLESSEKSLREGLFNEEQVAWAKLVKGSAGWRKKLVVLLRKWLVSRETEQRDGVVAEESAALQKLQKHITAALKQARKADEKRQAESRRAEGKRRAEAQKAACAVLEKEETEGRTSVAELQVKAVAKIEKQLAVAEKKLQKHIAATTRKRETAAATAKQAIERDEVQRRRVTVDEEASALDRLASSFRKATVKAVSNELEVVHAKGKREVDAAEAAARAKLQKQITAAMKQARKAEEKREAAARKAEEERESAARKAEEEHKAEERKAARAVLQKEENEGRTSVAGLEGKAAAKIEKQLVAAQKKLQKQITEKEAKEVSRREALAVKEKTARSEVATKERKERSVAGRNFTLGAERHARTKLESEEDADREALAEHAPAANRLSQLAELLDLITTDVDLQERCEEVFKYEEPPPVPLAPVGRMSRSRLSIGLDSPERQPRSSVLEPPQRRQRPSSARIRPGEPLDHVMSSKRSRLSSARPERTVGETTAGTALPKNPPRRSEGQYRAPPPSPLSEVKGKSRGRLRVSAAGKDEDIEPRPSTASAVSRRPSRSAPPSVGSELRAVTRISRPRLQVAAPSEDSCHEDAPGPDSRGAPTTPSHGGRRSVPRKEAPLSTVSGQQRRRLQASTLSDDDRAPSEPRNSVLPKRGSVSRRDSSVGRASMGRSSRGGSQRVKELDVVVPACRPRLRPGANEAKEETPAADENASQETMPTQGSLFTPAPPPKEDDDGSTVAPPSPREDMAEPKLGEFLSLPEESARDALDSDEEADRPMQGELLGQAPPPKRRRSLYSQPAPPVAKEQRRPSVNLPRGARSAFHFFCDARMPDLMKQNRDRSYSQLRQWLRDAWELLPECERAEFEHKQACSVATALQQPAPVTPNVLSSQTRPSVEAKAEPAVLSPFSRLMAEERRKAEQVDRVPEPAARQPRMSILRRSEGRSQGRQDEPSQKDKEGRRSRSRVRWAEEVHVHRGRDSGGSYDEPMAKD